MDTFAGLNSVLKIYGYFFLFFLLADLFKENNEFLKIHQSILLSLPNQTLYQNRLSKIKHIYKWGSWFKVYPNHSLIDPLKVLNPRAILWARYFIKSYKSTF